jgi:hypothetical protein
MNLNDVFVSSLIKYDISQSVSHNSRSEINAGGANNLESKDTLICCIPQIRRGAGPIKLFRVNLINLVES